MRESFAKGGWPAYVRYMTGPDRPEFFTYATVAGYYASVGEKDKAFAALEKSYELRESNLIRLKVDPRLSSLRDDPRFADLARRVGIP